MTQQVFRSAYPLLASIYLLLLCSLAAMAQQTVPPAESETVVALRSAKYIYVKSSSLLVGTAVIEEKLQKRIEFSQMGLIITRDEAAADIILEVHHDHFTKYVYTAIDAKRKIIVAGGKLSSLGGTVADKVAKRFLKQVMQARATAPTSSLKAAPEPKDFPINAEGRPRRVDRTVRDQVYSAPQWNGAGLTRARRHSIGTLTSAAARAGLRANLCNSAPVKGCAGWQILNLIAFGWSQF